VLAPAMNDRMYAHPATQDNLTLLRARGIETVGPNTGELASHGEHGAGRMSEPEELVAACERLLAPAGRRGWAGVRVLVTAGGTREPIDPVRYIGNRSSGRMGLSLAAAAARRGADVTVIAANVSLPAPAGVRVIAVQTAAELLEACEARFDAADVLLMAAAVADFRPRAQAAAKIKKDAGPPALELEPTTDVLGTLSARRRPGQVLVGFAAETGERAIAYGREKLERKRLDAIVINDVSDTAIGFDSADNEVTVVTADGMELELERAGKDVIADGVLTRIDQLLTHGGREDSAAGAGPYRTTGV
jgi:phosphopantothenoylcysteine decarboxylase / phosphopantothenate---cysteine ligase